MGTGSRRPAPGQVRNVIFIVLLLAAVTIYSVLNRATPVTYDFGEDRFTLTGDKNAPYSVTVRYEDVRSIEHVTDLDLGTPVDGGDTGTCQYGIWQNDTYGQYRLYAWSKVTEYIVLHTEEGILVCNYEDAGATGGLYDGMVELLAQKQSGEDANA